ncbi:MAG TPA: hypothetical protein VNQ14_14070 [Woeseiaceae bacterium]|nr:hypothetical protein [Woeseiaceae bacterium]
MTRVALGLLAAFLIVIAAARFAYSVSTESGVEPVDTPWSQSRMEFVAWNDEKWTAWIRDDKFELVPQNTSDWSRHANPTIAFYDWDGNAWQVKIEGQEFILVRQGNWGGPVERSEALRYRDWSGNNQLRTVPDLRRQGAAQVQTAEVP